MPAQLIVAHRGASAEAPENTLAAFSLAWKREADVIEGDFFVTRDQQIVCIHDDTTERVAGTNLPVPQSTLAELQALDVGRWKAPRFAGLQMPSLADVLACVPTQKAVFLEIKCGPEIVPLMKRELEQSDLAPEQTVIISFKSEVIQAVKLAMPERQAYWLVDFGQEEGSGQWRPTCAEVIETARKIRADGVDAAGKVEVVNQQFVDRCHQAGLSVHVWTIDDPDQARLFQQLGVATITTNRPRELHRALFPSAPAPVPKASAPAAVLQTVPSAAVP